MPSITKISDPSAVADELDFPEHWNEQIRIIEDALEAGADDDWIEAVVYFYGLFDLLPMSKEEVAAAYHRECRPSAKGVYSMVVSFSCRCTPRALRRLGEIRNRPVIDQPTPKLSCAPMRAFA